MTTQPTTPSIFLVLAELNIIIKGDPEMPHREAQNMADEYIKANYPDEDWRYLGAKMQNSGKCRLVFQRTDLAPDDKFWVLGEGFTAPLKELPGKSDDLLDTAQEKDTP